MPSGNNIGVVPEGARYAVPEELKGIILLNNHGYHAIGRLQMTTARRRSGKLWLAEVCERDGRARHYHG